MGLLTLDFSFGCCGGRAFLSTVPGLRRKAIILDENPPADTEASRSTRGICRYSGGIFLFCLLFRRVRLVVVLECLAGAGHSLDCATHERYNFQIVRIGECAPAASSLTVVPVSAMSCLITFDADILRPPFCILLYMVLSRLAIRNPQKKVYFLLTIYPHRGIISSEQGMQTRIDVL